MKEIVKCYFTYNEIHRTIQQLSQQIINADFQFDLIVAIGTGGFIPARMLKTYINKSILTVGLSYYDEQDRVTDQPKKIQWIDEVENKLEGKRILLVDEVDDTRVTLSYCLNELYSHNPSEIGVAVLHNKKKAKGASFPSKLKRYFAGREIDDAWVCYPWDAKDIDAHDALAAAQFTQR
ncbi:MAG: phosphoribosyltransferase [Spartobacteria bacterium]|nr:phosphoribosyltransferase [Spartobacteria bacterium]